jgi:PAS domain S-box-containing protein
MGWTSRRTRTVLAAVGLGVGLVVLVGGWWLDLGVLRRLHPDLASMKALTALTFVLYGAGLLLVDTRRARLGQLAVGLGWSAVALMLSQRIFGWELGIDQLLAVDRDTRPPLTPGRISWITSLSFLVLGAAILLAPKRAPRLAQGLALTSLTASFFALCGSLYDVGALYRLLPYGSMAVHTAATMALLAMAVLLVRPDIGGMRVVTSTQGAGSLIRRLLIVISVVPVVTGLAFMRAWQRGLLDPPMTITLLVVTNVILVATLGLVAAARLRDSETRSSAVVARSLEAIVTFDPRGRVQSFNPAAERLFGYRPEAATGLPLETLILPPGDQPSAERRMGHRLEQRARRADGSEFPAEVAIVETEGGGMVGFVRDLTEQKAAELIHRRGIELAAENWRIRRETASKSQFLAQMSHELRTPLNAIIGFSELLHDERVGPVSEEQRGCLADVLAGGRHLLKLINEVLDLSKVEAGKLEFEPHAVEPGAVVSEVLALLKGAAAERRIELGVTIDPALETIVTDAARLRQVLYNYLANALRFTPPGGRISIRAEIENPLAFRLEVEDSGAGITPADLDKLFYDFQQLPGTAPGGTGLGLALTKRLVEAMGGVVGVDSPLGRGATFYAVVPRVIRRESHLPPRTLYAARSDSPVILLMAADTPPNADAIGGLSERGFALELVATPTQLLACARRRGFAAAVVEVGDGDHRETLGTVRTVLARPDRPVLVTPSPLALDVVASALARAGIVGLR